MLCECEKNEKRIENVSIYLFNLKKSHPLAAKNRRSQNGNLKNLKNLRELVGFIFDWLSVFLNDRFKTKIRLLALKGKILQTFQNLIFCHAGHFRGNDLNNLNGLNDRDRDRAETRITK